MCDRGIEVDLSEGMKSITCSMSSRLGILGVSFVV
jgi:hypothetical protein